MPSDALPLEPLQQWMQHVVTHPGPVADAVNGPEAVRIVSADELGRVILPSKTLKPIERIGIYHGMYMMRMADALVEDYAAVAAWLGEHAFGHLVDDYVQQHPSRSYTLNRLGDHLPAFIASSTLARRRFLSELATLELAMTQVFDEAEVAPMDADAIASVPAEEIERLRLRPIPALRLLELTYDVNSAFQSFRDDEQIHPVRRQSWLAVHRRDYSVYRLPLTKPEFVLLQALVSGCSLGEAITIFKRRLRRFPEQGELFVWFRDWSAAGLFAAIEIASIR